MNKSTNTTVPEVFSQNTPIETSPPKVQPYQSNPFYLCFDDLGTFFEKNTWWAIGITAGALLMAFISFVSNLIELLLRSTSENTQAANTMAPEQTLAISGIIGIVVAIVIFTLFLSTALQIFIGGMFAYVSLANHTGRSVGFSEAFNAVVKRFWRLFFAQILATLKIIAWTFLFIIPGIIAALRYALLPYVVMDEPIGKKGIVDSHNRTKNLVSGRKFEVFGIMTVSGIIPIIGPLIQLTGSAKLYRQLQIFHDNNLQKPKIHWLNYIGLIVLAAFVLLFFAMITILSILLSR
jgi:hypothetical protein